MITKERNTENFAFCIDLNRPLDKGPLGRGSLEPLSGIQCEINFINVGKDIRDELYNKMEGFKKDLQRMACQWRYLKLKEKLEVNLERIPEKELEAKYSRARERIVREMEELENQMEATKPTQEKPVSDEPDFVWRPDIKCKGDAEDFGVMSQEKFEEMLQHYLKSHPRCKFVEGNGSAPAGESLTAEGTKMPKEEPDKPKKPPYDILMGLSTEVLSILVKAVMGRFGVRTQSEYVELAAALLRDALKYDSLDSPARECNELIWKSAETLRSKSQGEAV